MSSNLVRLFLNTLRNYKPMLIPSMYRETNTYSIVEVNDSLNKAWNIYNKKYNKSNINYQASDKVSMKENRGWPTPHMFLKDKV